MPLARRWLCFASLVAHDQTSWLGVSLFSGAGIGDVGFRAAGTDFLALAELDPKRGNIARRNFPEAAVLSIDLDEHWELVCESVEARIGNRTLDLLSCTPPCQGMSKSGQGTLLRNIREGKRPKLDPRNRLILPGLRVVQRLRPRWVVFENVTEMRNTLIEDREGRLRPLLDIVADELAPDYRGAAYAVEFADYGVPQRRQRLITVLTRDPVALEIFDSGLGLVPAPTHSVDGKRGLDRWVSVSDALRRFPPLDAGAAEDAVDPDVPFHRVPVLDSKKYEWISHAGPGQSAFDNQCINPECGYQGNSVHGAKRTAGINQARKDTPIRCEKCGSDLPRPTTVTADGGVRLMSGYTSAYKRMRADKPAPAITRNISYPCSDHKVHPSQNRVLSLAEAFVLQTLSDYDWAWAGRTEDGAEGAVSDTLIRLVLGESVPPRFLEMLAEHLQALSAGQRRPGAAGTSLGSSSVEDEEQQLSLA